jgi:hypothetical protein
MDFRPDIGRSYIKANLPENTANILLAMKTMHSFANKFRILARLAKVALLAVPLLLLAAILHSHSPLPELSGLLAVLSAFPCLIYGYVLTILHWKTRYRGNHSDLWGVLILLEASGWLKLIYFFRHMLPDMGGRGRYSDAQALG